MTHREVFARFKTCFPWYAERVDEWFQNGKNSIRVRKRGGMELIFTFNSDKDWCLESVESFIHKLDKR